MSQDNTNILVVEASFLFVYIAIYVQKKENLPTKKHSWKVVHSIFYHSSEKISYPNKEVLNYAKDDWLYFGIKKVLKESNLKKVDHIALGSGPGSFTSMKIKNLFVESLAILWNVSIFHFSTYDFFSKLFSCQKNSTLLIRLNKMFYYNEKAELCSKNTWEEKLSVLTEEHIYIWEETWTKHEIPVWELPQQLWKWTKKIEIDSEENIKNIHEFVYSIPIG